MSKQDSNDAKKTESNSTSKEPNKRIEDELDPKLLEEKSLELFPERRGKKNFEPSNFLRIFRNPDAQIHKYRCELAVVDIIKKCKRNQKAS